MPSSSFVISEFRSGPEDTVARGIVAAEDVSALATACRAAFNAQSGSDSSDNFAETAGVAVDAVWKALLGHGEQEFAAATRMLAGLMRVLDAETARKAAAHFLFRFGVASADDEEHAEDLDGALQSVDSWMKQSPAEAAALVEELLVPMEVSEVAALTRRMVKTTRVKWRRFVSLLTAALKCFPGIEVSIRDMSSSLLTAGLENSGGGDFKEFKRGMIVARAGSFTGCDGFHGGYANWFAKAFGDEQTSLGRTFIP